MPIGCKQFCIKYVFPVILLHKVIAQTGIFFSFCQRPGTLGMTLGQGQDTLFEYKQSLYQ